MKKKYYAIKIAIDRDSEKIVAKNKIVNSWKDCLKIIYKRPSVYKSFDNTNDCINFFDYYNSKRLIERLKLQEEQMNKKDTIYNIKKKQLNFDTILETL